MHNFKKAFLLAALCFQSIHTHQIQISNKTELYTKALPALEQSFKDLFSFIDTLFLAITKKNNSKNIFNLGTRQFHKPIITDYLTKSSNEELYTDYTILTNIVERIYTNLDFTKYMLNKTRKNTFEFKETLESFAYFIEETISLIKNDLTTLSQHSDSQAFKNFSQVATKKIELLQKKWNTSVKNAACIAYPVSLNSKMQKAAQNIYSVCFGWVLKPGMINR